MMTSSEYEPFQPGQILTCSSGAKVELGARLAGFSRGTIYSSRLEGRTTVLRWYSAAFADDLKPLFRQLLKKGSPYETFEWPVELVEVAGNKGIGLLFLDAPGNY